MAGNSEFGIVDLSTPAGDAFAQPLGMFILDDLEKQLVTIRDGLIGVTKDQPAGFSLQSLEIDLTIGAEGKVWFIAKGSAEASIKLTFGPPK